MDETNRKSSWWHTVPGMLTGAAALITAVTGAIIGISQLDPDRKTVAHEAASESSTSPSSTLAPSEAAKEAAIAFIAAWRADDRIAAAKVAEPSGVDKAFGREPPTMTPAEPQCDPVATGECDCAFTLVNGMLIIRLAETDHGWRVIDVTW